MYKNKLLAKAILESGFDSISSFARHCEMSNTTVNHYMNYTLSPYNKQDDIRTSMERISDALGLPVYKLFPGSYLKSLGKDLVIFDSDLVDRSISTDLSPEETFTCLEARENVAALLDSTIDKVAEVTDVFIIIYRFGLFGYPKLTLRETVDQTDCPSKERVRQREAKMLRYLRHPSRACIVYDYAKGIL